jgi:hypothetical protein
MNWLGRHRMLAGAAACAVVIAIGVVYLTSVSNTPPPAGDPTPLHALPWSGGLRFVEESDGRQTVRDLAPNGAQTSTSLRCDRYYASAGTSVCLRLSGPGPSYEAAVLDDRAAVIRSVPLGGVPSRARVSASGRVVSWTVFVTGHSYATPGGFSTQTGYYDRQTGTEVDSLESFAVTVDGNPFSRANVNFWGMTVASDDRTFYATLGSGTQTWLMRGDLLTHTMTNVHTSAECPSLAPDQRHVVYKKRGGRGGTWQLVVLDLTTGKETVLPGTSGVDDQAAWLDDHTVAYMLRPGNIGPPAIYVSGTDGIGQPRLLIANASSPSPVT